MPDPDDYRRASLEKWERAAEGWAARREEVQRVAMPLSRWMVDAIRPQPGHRVLELAAGVGDTGFLAAELIKPGGTLISSDWAEPMVEAAKARARELGVDNVEFRVLDAEWIDLETASTDGLLCRFGYQLVADPGAALREARRVLRPGGRVALAAWAAAEHNPWAALPGRELAARGHMPTPEPGSPGMFSFADPGRVEDLLGEAGFLEVEVVTHSVRARYPDADAWWDVTIDCSRPFADALAKVDPAERDELRERLAAEARAFAQPDGTLAVPGLALLAAGTA